MLKLKENLKIKRGRETLKKLAEAGCELFVKKGCRPPAVRLADGAMALLAIDVESPAGVWLEQFSSAARSNLNLNMK